MSLGPNSQGYRLVMHRVFLWALVGAAAYGTSFHSPGPSLTRIAPDRVLPRQHPMTTGFWGASAKLWLTGPEQETFARGTARSVPIGYPVEVTFNAALAYDSPRLKETIHNVDQEGFLRMVPNLWYGVRADRPDALVADGRAACSGIFYWFKPRRPEVPKGWQIVSEKKARIPLAITYPNPAYAGGGIGVRIQEPKGWRLADIGLTADQDYVVFSDAAWDNPLSTWDGKKPNQDQRNRYQMDPIVLAEVSEATLADPTGTHHTTITPTGWVMGVGHFRSAATM